MRLIRIAMLAMLATATAAAFAGDRKTRYVELINRAHDSMASFAIAAAGSEDFADVPLGTPLHGGGDSTTVGLATSSCRYDLRFTFVDGRTMSYPDVDICRYPRVRIRHLPQADESTQNRASVAASDAARHP